MKSSDKKPLLDIHAKRYSAGFLLLALTAILVLSMIDFAGPLGEKLHIALVYALGTMKWLVPLAVLLYIYLLFKLPEEEKIRPSLFISIALLLFCVASLFHLFFLWRGEDDKLSGGGYIGGLIAQLIFTALGFWGAFALNGALIAIMAIIFIAALPRAPRPEIPPLFIPSGSTFSRLITTILRWVGIFFRNLFEFINRLFSFIQRSLFTEKSSVRLKAALPRARQFTQRETEQKEEIDQSDSEQQKLFEEKPTFVKKKYRPHEIGFPLNLLEISNEEASAGDVKLNKLLIEKTLNNFDIKVEMADVHIGPTVTQYTLKPAEGVKLSTILSLQNDLALALAAHPIRIEAPIPGKSLVGIEVPNQKIALVRLKEILASDEFKKRNSNLTIALGRDVMGKTAFADLGRMPHALVAGATGSGKTVMINSIILSLLYQNSPDDLKFILIDPKRVELTLYEDIPHLLSPTITSVPQTIHALRWAIGEMDRRFDILSKAKKRDIGSFNETAEEKMPYIVIIIDELADLMSLAAQEIETCIIRLAQMSRAVGIHLILATQRPSVDVITGLIKANITTRLAFSVASMNDSRTILDFGGAEKLLGRGDMLFISPELSKPRRIQGAYVSDKELKRISEYLKNQIGIAEYEVDFHSPVATTNGNGSSSAGENGLFGADNDELLLQAKEIVMRADKASASLLQRRLRIGYARAARLLDLLERDGIIGPPDGSKPREILIHDQSYELEKQADALIKKYDVSNLGDGTEQNEDKDSEQKDGDNPL